MSNGENMGSVKFFQMRPEFIDWKGSSNDPAIRHFVPFLSSLMVESRNLVSGLNSEMITGVEEATVSQFADGTNRVLRVTADTIIGPVEFDVIVQLAAPTAFTFSGE